MAAIVLMANEAHLRAVARDLLLAEGYVVSETVTLEEALRIATARARERSPAAQGVIPRQP